MMIGQVNAACSREDVVFYLDKGFSHSQITTLCSESLASEEKTLNNERQSSKKVFVEISADELFLKTAIKASNIYLKDNSLHYTHKVCVEYGEEDLFGFTPRICPQVKFIVVLDGLKVIDVGKRNYFYGTEEIRVKASVKREIIGGLEEQGPENRNLILEKIKKSNEVAIPLRDDFSPERVKQILLKLAS